MIRMFKSNKRGEGGINDIFLLIAELILLAVIGLTFIYWVNGLVEDTLFQKNYLARDFSLTVDSMLGGQGGYQFKYPVPINDLGLEMSDNEIGFYDSGSMLKDNKANWGIYFFGKAPTVKPIPSKLEKEDEQVAPVFFRNGYEISVKDWNKGDIIETSLLNCPYNDTKDENFDITKQILFDSGHGKTGEVITGLVNKDASGAVIKSEQAIAKMIVFNARARDEHLHLTKGDPNNEKDISLVERKNAQNFMDLMISIHLYSDSNPKSNDLRVYVSAESESKIRSLKLGCFIVNRIKARMPDSFTGLSLNVLDMDELPDDDPYQILDTNIPAVVIEVGNINSPAEVDYDVLTNSLLEGLGGYFS